MPSDEIIETMAREYAGAPFASKQAIARMKRAIAAAETAGSVMVPRENVQAMIDRLQFCLDTFGPVQDHSSEAADLDDWRAMIEARP